MDEKLEEILTSVENFAETDFLDAVESGWNLSDGVARLQELVERMVRASKSPLSLV